MRVPTIASLRRSGRRLARRAGDWMPRLTGHAGTLYHVDRALRLIGEPDPTRAVSYAVRIGERSPPAIVYRARLLMQAGLHAEALERLVDAVVAGRLPPDERARAAIAAAARESVRQVDADTALALLRRLAAVPDHAALGRLALLDLASRRFLFEPDVLADAEARLAAADETPANRLLALQLLLARHGVSDAVRRGAAALAESLPAHHRHGVRRLAAVLHAAGEERRLAALFERFRKELEPLAGTTPAIAAAYLAAPGAKDPAKLAAARRMIALLDGVRAAQAALLGTFADPAPTVAVVGNSPCEIGRGRGAEIDGHDRVVRFNRFSTEPPFAADYGRRVDIWIRPIGRYDAMPPPGRGLDVILSGLQGELTCPNWDLVERLVGEGHRVSFLPPAFQIELLERMKRAPSAGLTVAWTAARLRRGRPGLDFYGFAFVDQIGPGAGSAHYFDAARPSGRHAWAEEKALFEEVTGRRLTVPARPVAAEAGPERPRIRFLGDHGSYHAGSGAVTDYFLKEIAGYGVLAGEDEPFDVLLVNGEGSMHHSTRTHRRKMEAIAAALARGKRVYLVNSVWEANDHGFDHVLRAIHGIYVREAASQRALKRHGIRAEVRLDVSYWAEIDETAPFTDLGGRVVATDFYSREFGNFVRMTGGPLKALPYVDMIETSWSSLVRTLRTASVLVTGRHHAVFAACRARVPFVAMRGNTHKIDGMVGMAGLPIPIASRAAELPDMIAWAEQNRAVYDAFFAWMDAQPRLRLAEIERAAGVAVPDAEERQATRR